MGVRLMAIVVEGVHGRAYLSPTPEAESIAQQAQPEWRPATSLPDDPRAFTPILYGFHTHGSLFSPRQLVALTTFSDLVQEARKRVRQDALTACMTDDRLGLEAAGADATAYADAVAVYLAMAIDKASDYNSTLVLWSPTRDQAKTTFARQALPMIWDFSEVNVFAGAAGDLAVSLEGIARTLSHFGNGHNCSNSR
jgi:putative DNA methylase